MTDAPIQLSRHRLDLILSSIGGVVVLVLVVAGGLLSWGNSFAEQAY